MVSVYVLIMINFNEIKDRFYEEFDFFIVFVLKLERFIIFGDFNVRVGNDY